MEPTRIPLWARAIADGAFREALIADPLRALAEAPGVAATPDQIRELEGMAAPERETLVREVLREAMARRARQQWGDRCWSPDMDLDTEP
ncbi:MAG: hypothetical protein U0Y82_10495 [Thermoleophilia bacterium]